MKAIFKKRYKEEYEFLPDALEIIESPNSPLGSLIIWMIFILMLLAIIWSYIGKVDMVATARGKIIPMGNVKVVQPIEEGIITAIHIEDGQSVEKGELLVELDTSIQEVDVSTYQKLLDMATLEKEVLMKVIDGEIIDSVVNNHSNNLEEAEHIVDYYNVVRSNYNSKMAIYNSQLEQDKINLQISQTEVQKVEHNLVLTENSISSLKSSIKNGSAQEEKLKVVENEWNNLKEEEDINHQLYEAGVISQSEWKKKSNEVEIAEGEYLTQKKIVEQEKRENSFKLEELENNLDLYQKDLYIETSNVQLAESEIYETEKNIESLIQEDKEILLGKLVEKENEITKYNAEVEKGKKSINYNHLYAPVNGKVYGLTINTIGEIAKPAESLLTIVPEGTELIVEVLLINKDIGFVKEEQEVAVKVDTFPFQKYGALKGEIVHISPNAYLDEKLGYVYKVKIIIEKPYLELNGLRYDIVPGMEVTAEIKTGKRRVIDFFLEPLVKYIDESIKLR